MGAFIVRRLIAVFFMLVALVATTFVMFSALPADPAALSCGKNCEPQQIEVIRERLGLDESMGSQLARYAIGIPCGRFYPADGPIMACPAFDDSLQPQDGPVRVPSALPRATPSNRVTTSPASSSRRCRSRSAWPWEPSCSSSWSASCMGIYAALRRGRWQDRTTMGAALIGYSFPSFFIGLVLLYFVVFLPPKLFDGWQPLALSRVGSVVGESPGLGAGVDPAVDHVGHALCRLLRAAHPQPDARDARRGLHPHRSRRRACPSARSSSSTVCGPVSRRSSRRPGLDLAFLLGGADHRRAGVRAARSRSCHAVDAISDSDLQLIIGDRDRRPRSSC